MAFEFGMFHEFQRTAGITDEAAFATSFEEIDAAERWGLDAMWLAEIHVNPERSVCSAPLTLAGAIAARTKRMKVGTGVQVLPLCHPLRLAEEAATVDQISQGRLIFGVGRSGFARTYAAYGVPYAESRERFAETLDIVQRAWTEDTFTHEGKYFQYHDVCVVPKPYQKPHPPIRVAATSVDTFPAIGAQGFDLFAAVRTGTLSELAPNLVAYRSAYTAAGHSGKGGVFMRVPVYVAETFDKAVEDCRDSIMAFYRQLGEQLERSAGEAGARAIEQRDVRGRRLQETTFDEVLREKVIVGTPAMVVERLASITSELELDGILAELNCGGQVPREGVINSLKLLCDEVMP